jgi:hypothetical protein
MVEIAHRQKEWIFEKKKLVVEVLLFCPKKKAFLKKRRASFFQKKGLLFDFETPHYVANLLGAVCFFVLEWLCNVFRKSFSQHRLSKVKKWLCSLLQEKCISEHLAWLCNCFERR